MKKADIVLIGAGIMSASLATFLRELDPGLDIEIFERLDKVSLESSDALNNSGTGHSAFCELNYTQEIKDGSINMEKAIKIAESFEISKQFWSYLVEKKHFEPSEFINSVAHMSFVEGEENVNFLKKRHDTMSKNILFRDMQYSSLSKKILEWAPLIMEGRKEENVAATYMKLGTDINFGALTRSLLKNFKINLNHEVTDVKRNNDAWNVFVTNTKTKEKNIYSARFVFIGAGGYALPLIQKSEIPEAKGFGGFPVGGKWLLCKNEEIIKNHNVKVYGQASVGAPPMSVPHLDTRIINNKKELLFGPFAGFSTKFLKNGSYLDLFNSLNFSNIIPMISAGLKNALLTKYLVEQLLLSSEDRLKALQDFMPLAKASDWELYTAGQRVQIIKNVPGNGAVIEFGTEVVCSKDGTIAALLGASPGASTSVSIMLDLLNKCFSEKIKSTSWQKKLRKMIPSYGKSLGRDEKLVKELRAYTSKTLKLNA